MGVINEEQRGTTRVKRRGTTKKSPPMWLNYAVSNARPVTSELRRFVSLRIPVLFAGVTVLAYGLLLPLTGFYWDDWPFAWLAKFLGPAEFIPAFQGFRPFLGPIFFVTTSL